ncbi:MULTISPECIES: hypothetical protein [Rufibacter]|uniref:GLPGLI family protein n=1 Tax=Rufibacter quisquiliarum TaxID=1549639 RepID=A0A839GBY2_9BACT|nr:MULTISPECIES: hypothetical protein [Rufibacter]MBA9075820.1 hypothetical protein [Rufibacter quisquiliarum]
MKIWFLFFILSLASAHRANAQEAQVWLYKGKLDAKEITLYLKTQVNECGGKDFYTAMYRYSANPKWIELTTTTDYQNNFGFMEAGFTGVLLLKKSAKGLAGTWLSPDGKRQLPVSLVLQPLKATEKEKLEKALEETIYQNDDC